MIATLLSSPALTERTCMKSPQKNFTTPTVQTFALNSGITDPNLTIFFMRCTEVIENYSSEI